jgi:hypothetical protein
MSHELKEFSGLAEKEIEFDEDVCCALKRAFKMNPEVDKELEKIVGRPAINFFIRKLSNFDGDRDKQKSPQYMDMMETVYSQIAKRELERIEAEDEDDEDIVCGHSVDDHRESLELVLNKTKPVVH